MIKFIRYVTFETIFARIQHPPSPLKRGACLNIYFVYVFQHPCASRVPRLLKCEISTCDCVIVNVSSDRKFEYLSIRVCCFIRKWSKSGFSGTMVDRGNGGGFGKFIEEKNYDGFVKGLHKINLYFVLRSGVSPFKNYLIWKFFLYFRFIQFFDSKIFILTFFSYWNIF